MLCLKTYLVLAAVKLYGDIYITGMRSVQIKYHVIIGSVLPRRQTNRVTIVTVQNYFSGLQ